jgi:hypothetical protein
MLLWSVIGLLVAAAAGAAAIAAAGWPPDLALRPAAPASTPPSAPDRSLPLPRRAETALARAQALAARGELHDALASLDLVRPTDAEKAEADGMRADIQRQLMRLASGGGTPSGGAQEGAPVP